VRGAVHIRAFVCTRTLVWWAARGMGALSPGRCDALEQRRQRRAPWTGFEGWWKRGQGWAGACACCRCCHTVGSCWEGGRRDGQGCGRAEALQAWRLVAKGLFGKGAAWQTVPCGTGRHERCGYRGGRTNAMRAPQVAEPCKRKALLADLGGLSWKVEMWKQHANGITQTVSMRRAVTV